MTALTHPAPVAVLYTPASSPVSKSHSWNCWKDSSASSPPYGSTRPASPRCSLLLSMAHFEVAQRFAVGCGGFIPAGDRLGQGRGCCGATDSVEWRSTAAKLRCNLLASQMHRQGTDRNYTLGSANARHLERCIACNVTEVAVRIVWVRPRRSGVSKNWKEQPQTDCEERQGDKNAHGDQEKSYNIWESN